MVTKFDSQTAHEPSINILEANTRIQWIDIAKALGILLVVLGHLTNSSSYIGHWISSFHMPLFFVLSGICFSPLGTLSKYINKKFISLIYPYFTFGICLAILHVILCNYGLLEIISHTKKHFLNYGAMWFVPILFFAQVLFKFVYSKRIWINISSMIIFTVFGYLLSKNNIDIGYSLTTIFMATAYVEFGYLIKDKLVCLFENKLFYYIIPFMLIVYSYIIYAVDSVNINMSGNDIPRLGTIPLSIMGLLMFCYACYWLSMLKCTRLHNALSWLGKNTIIILALHMFFIKLSTIYIYPYISSKLEYKAIELIFVYTLSILSIIVINRYIPWMVSMKKLIKK